MLQKLRDKTSGWIATVILGLLMIPFAFFGIEQYMVQRSDTYVAKIDAPPSWWKSAPAWWPASVFWQHEEISVDEFRSNFERARQRARAEQGDKFDARAFENIDNKRQVLDILVDQRVQELSAADAGLSISDELVRKTIQGEAVFQVDNKFNPDRYRLWLASQIPPQTPRQLEQTIRDDLQQSILVGGVGRSSFVTTSEAQRLIRLKDEKRDVSMLQLPPPPLDAGAVTAAEVQAWYKAHQAAYRAPETVSIEYVDLDTSTMPMPPTADEATLRQRYEQEKKRYVQQEERLASHILVQVEPKATAAVQKAAEQKALQLAAQAHAPGADFAAIARASSDDTGSKAGGGDLGWVSKGMMSASFEQALFAMKVGEISAPVKSDFGWHIIQFRESKGGTQETFEQARETLAREQAEADRERAFNDLSSRLVDLVYKNPSSLIPAARQVNLPVQKLGPFARNGGEGVAAQPAVQRAAFSDSLIQDGTVSDPIEIGAGHSVLIRVTAHTPERLLPLGEVRDRVIAAVRVDRTSKVATKAADALVARIRAGETLEAVATSMGLPAPQNAAGMPRGAQVIAPGASDAFFAVATPTEGKPSPGKVVTPDGGVVLFAVTKATPGEVASLTPEQLSVKQQIAQIYGISDVETLIKALRKRMKVKVIESNL